MIRKICFILCIFLILITGCSNKEDDYKCPDCNVVLISIDALRADHLPCYGYFRDTAPNICNLAENGILFENAFSHASVTVPSHMSIFTSLYPSTHKLCNLDEFNKEKNICNYELGNFKTIAEILQENGYYTIGLTGGAQFDVPFGFERGFDSYGEVYISKILSNLSSLNKGKKYFVFIHTYKVHWPYLPEKKYNIFDEWYNGTIIETGEEYYNSFKSDISGYNGYFSRVKNERDLEHLKAMYDGAILNADDYLGDIIKSFDKKKTIFVITADHGQTFLEHGQFAHGNSLYDEQIHVPLIIRSPNLPEGVKIKNLVGHIDVLPTILDILDIQNENYFQGTSLVPIIFGKKTDRMIFTELIRNDSRLLAIRDKEWKYLYEYNLDTNRTYYEELYNLKKDPKEKDNVIGKHPLIEEELKKKINEYRDRDKITNITKIVVSEIEEETVEKLKALGYIK